MSEVGLVPFARVALEVSREVVPAYSHRFSPQRFTQPQLLEILCLMRYEDWTSKLLRRLWPKWCAVFKAAGLGRARTRGQWRWMLRAWRPDLSARFSFAGVSSMAALQCRGATGSNGSWRSIRV